MMMLTVNLCKLAENDDAKRLKQKAQERQIGQMMRNKFSKRNASLSGAKFQNPKYRAGQCSYCNSINSIIYSKVTCNFKKQCSKLMT